MKLTFKVLGYTITTLELELPAGESNPVEEIVETVIERGIKKTSKWWLKGLFK